MVSVIQFSPAPCCPTQATHLYDENLFHIRSFHASHRFEPIKMVLSAMYFLGCLRDTLRAAFSF